MKRGWTPAGILASILAGAVVLPSDWPARPAVADMQPAVQSLLIDQFGHSVGAEELAGHWLLVYFGYAGCPDLCPTALTRMTAALYRLGSASNNLIPIFVSIDTVHDTPERLREYASHFHPRLRALTGSEGAIRDAAHTFGVALPAASPKPIGSTHPTAGAFAHGVLIYLVAPDGRVVQAFHPEQPMADLVKSLRSHLSAEADQ